jgi:hypothetical protein
MRSRPHASHFDPRGHRIDIYISRSAPRTSSVVTIMMAEMAEPTRSQNGVEVVTAMASSDWSSIMLAEYQNGRQDASFAESSNSSSTQLDDSSAATDIEFSATSSSPTSDSDSAGLFSSREDLTPPRVDLGSSPVEPGSLPPSDASFIPTGVPAAARAPPLSVDAAAAAFGSISYAAGCQVSGQLPQRLVMAILREAASVEPEQRPLHTRPRILSDEVSLSLSLSLPLSLSAASRFRAGVVEQHFRRVKLGDAAAGPRLGRAAT